MYKEITSVSNPLIKETRTLLSAKGRAQHGCFLAEGEHLCQEALAAGERPEKLFVLHSAAEAYGKLVSACAEKGTEIFLLSESALNAISETKTPQGISMILPCRAKEMTAPCAGKLAVALDGVQDPGNLGTILRTAVAVGADYVLASDACADFYTGKTVRASMGAVFHIPLFRTHDLPAALQAHEQENWRCLCADLRGGDFYARSAREKNMLLVGSEGQGVSPACRDACSETYRLPMAPKAESLNAAVACGIMLYDLWRNH